MLTLLMFGAPFAVSAAHFRWLSGKGASPKTLLLGTVHGALIAFSALFGLGAHDFVLLNGEQTLSLVVFGLISVAGFLSLAAGLIFWSHGGMRGGLLAAIPLYGVVSFLGFLAAAGVE